MDYRIDYTKADTKRRISPGINITMSPALLFLLAGLMLLLPLQWVAAIVMAVLVHECFHAAAICLLGGRICRIFIGATGAVLETTPLSGLKELFAALAGPIGSGLLLLLYGHFPRLALCGAIHCAYNLIPLFPLDGGRVLKNLLFCLLPTSWALRIYSISQRLVILMLIGISIFVIFRVGILPLIAILLLLRRRRLENPLANRMNFRYNRGNTDEGAQI